MTIRYLQVIPDQNYSFTLGKVTFAIHLYPFRDLMYIDIKAKGEYVARGKRVLPNAWLLPSYVAEGIGNIRFETYVSDGDEYVWYEGFNKMFRLTSYTDAEIKELNKKA